MYRILSDDELLNDPEFAELRNHLDIADDDKWPLIDMWHDCDYVKAYGEFGRGNLEFFDCKLSDTRYVVTNGAAADSQLKVLKWFLDGHETDKDNATTWDDWDKVRQGVAYRGGSGYAYSLYTLD